MHLPVHKFVLKSINSIYSTPASCILSRFRNTRTQLSIFQEQYSTWRDWIKGEQGNYWVLNYCEAEIDLTQGFVFCNVGRLRQRLLCASDWLGLVVRWWLGWFKWKGSKTRLVSSGSFKDDFPNSHSLIGLFGQWL